MKLFIGNDRQNCLDLAAVLKKENDLTEYLALNEFEFKLWIKKDAQKYKQYSHIIIYRGIVNESNRELSELITQFRMIYSANIILILDDFDDSFIKTLLENEISDICVLNSDDFSHQLKTALNKGIEPIYWLRRLPDEKKPKNKSRKILIAFIISVLAAIPVFTFTASYISHKTNDQNAAVTAFTTTKESNESGILTTSASVTTKSVTTPVVTTTTTTTPISTESTTTTPQTTSKTVTTTPIVTTTAAATTGKTTTPAAAVTTTPKPATTVTTTTTKKATTTTAKKPATTTTKKATTTVTTTKKATTTKRTTVITTTKKAATTTKKTTTKATTTTPKVTTTKKTTTTTVTTTTLVPIPLRGLALKTSSPDNTVYIKVGETTTVTPIFTPAQATNKKVTWSSNREDRAVIDQNGVVTGRSPGAVIIQCVADDGGLSAACMIVVTE